MRYLECSGSYILVSGCQGHFLVQSLRAGSWASTELAAVGDLESLLGSLPCSFCSQAWCVHNHLPDPVCTQSSPRPGVHIHLPDPVCTQSSPRPHVYQSPPRLHVCTVTSQTPCVHSHLPGPCTSHLPEPAELQVNKASEPAGALLDHLRTHHTGGSRGMEEGYLGLCPDPSSVSLWLPAWHILGGLRDKCVIHTHIYPFPPFSFLLSSCNNCSHLLATRDPGQDHPQSAASVFEEERVVKVGLGHTGETSDPVHLRPWDWCLRAQIQADCSVI